MGTGLPSTTLGSLVVPRRCTGPPSLDLGRRCSAEGQKREQVSLTPSHLQDLFGQAWVAEGAPSCLCGSGGPPSYRKPSFVPELHDIIMSPVLPDPVPLLQGGGQ